MINKTVEKINIINKEIQELEVFTDAVCPLANIQRGSGSWDINALLKVKTEKYFSLFASRWWGMGTTRIEINVPNMLIDELYLLTHQKLERKKEQLQSLLRTPNNQLDTEK